MHYIHPFSHTGVCVLLKDTTLWPLYLLSQCCQKSNIGCSRHAFQRTYNVHKYLYVMMHSNVYTKNTDNSINVPTGSGQTFCHASLLISFIWTLSIWTLAVCPAVTSLPACELNSTRNNVHKTRFPITECDCSQLTRSRLTRGQCFLTFDKGWAQ